MDACRRIRKTMVLHSACYALTGITNTWNWNQQKGGCINPTLWGVHVIPDVSMGWITRPGNLLAKIWGPRTPASLPQLARISKSEDIWAPYPSVPKGAAPKATDFWNRVLISSPITYTRNMQDLLVDVSHFCVETLRSFMHREMFTLWRASLSQVPSRTQDPVIKFKCAVILDFCLSFFTSYVAAQSAFFHITCASRV